MEQSSILSTAQWPARILHFKLLRMIVWSIDPLHVCGNAAKLEDKTKEIFASVKQSYCSVLQIGCIPTDVKGVYSGSH